QIDQLGVDTHELGAGRMCHRLDDADIVLAMLEDLPLEGHIGAGFEVRPLLIFGIRRRRWMRIVGGHRKPACAEKSGAQECRGKCRPEFHETSWATSQSPRERAVELPTILLKENWRCQL